jgi:formamidopyrimidine-DNA glycosylase
MGDPRNVAHAKKVSQEKHHKGKTAAVKKSKPVAAGSAPVQPAESAKPEQTPDAAKLDKSLAVLAKLKELEFHSRANIEKLAELSLTIEDELKQKPFVEAIGDVYAAEEAFHSKISPLIEAYQTECDRLKPAG